ncbi:MAG TPA: ATP-binding protein [Thermoanaerobaculia bacterium]|nr:ATP-binding protein [Thermoanaerobaculia bacterium]
MAAAPQADPRLLIAIRVVVVTTLILAALIIQFTAGDIVVPLDYLYFVAGVCYALTIAYIIAGRLIRNRATNLYIQFAGDVFIETMLVYFTGGIDSPFSFLYLVTIITASMLLYRRGGLIVASGAVILYGGLADLMYFGVLPAPPQTFFAPTQWSTMRLYLNIATNLAGFYATALLTSYISEKLRRTYEELDLNRQNLAQLRALNENVVASIPSGLLALEEGGVVAFINPAACEILGLPPDRAVARHVTDLGLFNPAEWSSISEKLRTSPLVRGEFDGFRRGEELISLGYALTLLRTLEGDSAGLTFIFQDLTEMKKLEAQLRMKDRMAAVGELSAGIAHEIRNPLAAIAGSVQVLRSSKSLSAQEQRLMSIILKESERLNKTIAEFLRFVKPHERRHIEFDVAASLTETLELLSNSPEVGPDHSIAWSIDPSSFILHGDPDQISQVFWNLVRNAFQAMPAGGTLRVTTEVAGDAYLIRFRDEGRGMSERERRSLFQPFRTSFPAGTGLGMAISYRIVQEHGGRLDVESVPGAGTTITLALPVGAEDASPAASPDLAEATERHSGG